MKKYKTIQNNLRWQRINTQTWMDETYRWNLVYHGIRR